MSDSDVEIIDGPTTPKNQKVVMGSALANRPTAPRKPPSPPIGATFTTTLARRLFNTINVDKQGDDDQ